MHWFESNPPQLATNCQLQAVPHCFVAQVIGNKIILNTL